METVCIFATDDLGEAENVRDILEAKDIPTMVKNLYTQNLFGGLKPFSGHDPIAGSIQIFVREDDLEKGLAILEESQGLPIQEGPEDLLPEEPYGEKVADEAFLKAAREKRLIYFANLLGAFSFLVLPYFVNLLLLRRLYSTRRSLALMILGLSSVLAAGGLFFMLRSHL